MRSEIMITPSNDRILLSRTGTDNQQNYRDSQTKQLIQYSDISLILLHNLYNAKLFYTATKSLSNQNNSNLDP